MEQTNDFKKFSQVTDDRWYPCYHLAAPFGWCNDPNGMCYYKGQYHFFYQHYPYAPQWGPMHWGHAVSDDLAYWKHLPIALKPEKPYETGGGCFSGSAIEKDDKLWLMYTGHLQATDEERELTGYNHVEMQCLAYSEDGVHFEKYPINPVIEDIHEDDICTEDVRDPKVWSYYGKYYAIIGARTADRLRGQILFFKSNDFIHWSLINIAARSNGELGAMWECPNFAKIDGNDVLIFSPMELDTARFYHDKTSGVLIGKLDYKTGTFEHDDYESPDKDSNLIGKLDYKTGIFEFGDFQYLDKGFDFYAPQVMKTPDGRTITIGWLSMWGAEMHEAQDGWAGQMTIPRELRVKNGKIFSLPVKELQKLRKGKEISYKKLSITEPTKLDGISGEACELIVNVDAAKSKKFSIAVRAGEGEQTILRYDSNGTFAVDRNNSGLIGSPAGNFREIHFEPTNKIKLHIFIDRSSVEVFINDGAEVFSARVYPKRESQDIIFTPEDEVLAIDDVTYYKLDKALQIDKI